MDECQCENVCTHCVVHMRYAFQLAQIFGPIVCAYVSSNILLVKIHSWISQFEILPCSYL